jgi:hypothetical protein
VIHFQTIRLYYYIIEDEEEENRINQRRQEEDERKKKLMQKMNDEIRIKQEFRDNAREYHERFRE